MASPQEQEDLQNQYKHLQHDWNSFKRSNPHHISRRRHTTQKPTTEILQLMDSSPRTLITSLQQNLSPSDGWKVRTNDLAIEEIVRERQAAIESGKLKGRRLFDAMEGAGELGLHGKEEICSSCSSVLIQRSELQSWSSYTSDDDDDNGSEDCSCSCSCSSFCEESMKREVVCVEKEGDGFGGVGFWDGGRWKVGIAGLALMLMVFVLGLKSWKKSLDGEDENLVPT